MKRFTNLKCVSILLMVACVLLITAFVGCSKKSEPKEIKIGVLTSLTGESARYGQSALNGIQIAVDEINSKGGIKGKPIRLVIEDDGSQSSRAVSAFRKIAVTNGVPVIIGPISSSAAMSCSPIANDLKVVLFSPSAATPAFTSPNDYTFRNRVSSEFEISELARISREKLGLQKVAVLYVNNDFGLGSKRSFEKVFQESGGTIPVAETFEEGSTDVRTQLSKIKELKPDGIFLVGQGAEGGYALRQAYELGIKLQFLSALSIQRTDVLQIAGEAANGVVYAAPMYDLKFSESTKEFEKKYKEKYGEESDLFSGNGYDAVYIIAQAIETGGYTSDGIRASLFKIKDYPGITGSTSFDNNGDVKKPVAIKKIQNGKFVYLEDP